MTTINSTAIGFETASDARAFMLAVTRRLIERREFHAAFLTGKAALFQANALTERFHAYMAASEPVTAGLPLPVSRN